MLLETLKIFCDVAETKSFSDGAKLNDVTQSRATQSVRKIERELGVELIDRSNRPWKLTAEGEFCKSEFEKILRIYSGVEKKLKGISAGSSREVRVGAIYSVGFTYLTNVNELFRERYPLDALSVRYLHPEEVLKELSEDKLDFGIVSFPKLVAGDEYSLMPWKSEEMVLVVPIDHHLADRRTVKAAELNGCEMVSFDSDLVIAGETEKFLKKNGLTIPKALTFDNVEAIKRAVEVGQYISILPKSTLTRELSLGTLKAVSFSDASITRPLGVLYKKKQSLTTAMQHFLDLLNEL